MNAQRFVAACSTTGTALGFTSGGLLAVAMLGAIGPAWSLAAAVPALASAGVFTAGIAVARRVDR